MINAFYYDLHNMSEVQVKNKCRADIDLESTWAFSRNSSSLHFYNNNCRHWIIALCKFECVFETAVGRDRDNDNGPKGSDFSNYPTPAWVCNVSRTNKQQTNKQTKQGKQTNKQTNKQKQKQKPKKKQNKITRKIWDKQHL